VPRLQKPPVVYWLTAGSLALFGNGELGARLPTALAIVGSSLVTLAIGARLFGRRRGTVAAAIFATCLGTLLHGKIVAPEPFLTLGIGCTLLAAVRAVDDPARVSRWALVGWLGAALTCLTKGLHGALFPAVTLALVAAASPASRPALRAFLTWRGVALFLAVLAPWYLAIEARFPGYLADNLWNEQLGHVLDTHVPRHARSTPLLLFWLQHACWWFPWVLLVPAAILVRGRRRLLPAHPLAALPLAWLATVAAGVSVAAQRQDYYAFAAFPAFALLVSRAFAAGSDDRRLRPAYAIPALAVILLGVAVLALRAVELGGAETPTSLASRNNMAGVLAGFSSDDWARLTPLLVPSGLALLAAGAGLAAAVGRGRPMRGWVPLALGGGVLAGCAALGLQGLAPLFSLRNVAATIDAVPATDRGAIVFDGPGSEASSLAFYAHAPIRWLADPESEFAVRSRGVGRDRFVDEDALVARWESEPTWLVAESERASHWRAALGDDALGPEVARAGSRLLFASPALRARLHRGG
jgi:4-amino-4-deoxy-L-arabinose transferase-like glycosyltransferase